MPLASPDRCPICQTQNQAAPAFIAGEHRMYRCGNCRSAFVHPVPSPEHLRAFYSTFHLDATAGGWYDDADVRMQADFPAKLRLVQRVLTTPGARLLDVGCGKGFFVKAACDAGLCAEGIDLSDTGVRHATEKLGVKAACGLLADLKASLGLFDIVTFWATIEHLPDPIATLRDIRAVLRPGGHLLLDTGIGDDWLDRLLPGVVQWYDPPQHLFVFSEQGLRNALATAGFEVRHLDRSFERSTSRRAVRFIRSAALAAGLRTVAQLGRLRQGGFPFVRFPLGNLMMAVAQAR